MHKWSTLRNGVFCIYMYDASTILSIFLDHVLSQPSRCHFEWNKRKLRWALYFACERCKCLCKPWIKRKFLCFVFKHFHSVGFRKLFWLTQSVFETYVLVHVKISWNQLAQARQQKAAILTFTCRWSQAKRYQGGQDFYVQALWYNYVFLTIM